MNCLVGRTLRCLYRRGGAGMLVVHRSAVTSRPSICLLAGNVQSTAPWPSIALSRRFYSSEEHPFKLVDFEDIKDRCVKKNSFLLDCRNPDEIAELGKIPGAHNIPVGEMPEAFTQLKPQNFEARYGCSPPDQQEDIVVYCRSGKRAVTALYVLQQAGYDRLFLYKGSWLDWEEKNGPR